MYRKISVLFCYRDLEIERVKKCLSSLSTQLTSDVEVIFVDYGSEEYFSNKLKEVIKEVPNAVYCYNHTLGMPWNRGHALNTGIRLANGEFIFTCDIDIIFHPDFIAEIKRIVTSDIVYYFPVALLPKDFEDWSNLHKRNFRTTNLRGRGMSLVSKRRLETIKGYDEFFSFWGYEDNDLHDRLIKEGVKVIFYGKRIFLYHQWHPTYRENHELFPLNWRQFLKEYYYSKLHFDLGREEGNWGQLYSKNSRPALNNLTSIEFFSRFFGKINLDKYCLYRRFNEIASGQALGFIFVESTYTAFQRSFSVKFLNLFNRIVSDKLKLPFVLTNKNKVLNPSLYDYRDLFVEFVYLNKSKILDFAFFIDDNERKIVFSLVKK